MLKTSLNNNSHTFCFFFTGRVQLTTDPRSLFQAHHTSFPLRSIWKEYMSAVRTLKCVGSSTTTHRTTAGISLITWISSKSCMSWVAMQSLIEVIRRSSDVYAQNPLHDDSEDLNAPLGPGQEMLPNAVCERVLSEGACCNTCPQGQCFCTKGGYSKFTTSFCEANFSILYFRLGM